MTHTIRIEVSDEHNASATADANGKFPVAFIRKRLAADEINPASQRYDAATDTVQFSPDGGTTWLDAPTADPRNQSTFPPLTGSDVRCRSAASIVRYITDMTAEMTTAIGNGATGAGIGALLIALIGVLGPWGILLDLAIAIGIGVVAIGASAIAAALTTTVFDELLCILYCNMNDEGQLDGAGYTTVHTSIGTDIGGTAGTVLQLIVQLLGPAGLNNAAALGLDTDDCSGCGCNDCVPYADTFTGGLGPKTHFVPWHNIVGPNGQVQTNTYDGTVGHNAAGSVKSTTDSANSAYHAVDLVIDLGVECTVTGLIWWNKSSGSQSGRGTTAYMFDGSGTLIIGKPGSFANNANWQQSAPSVSQAGVRYVQFHSFVPNAASPLWMDDITVTLS